MVFGPRVVPLVLSWNPGINVNANPAAVICWRAVTGLPSMDAKVPATPAVLL